MKVETAIKNIKEQLISKVKKIGLWENFGQLEVRILEDKYGEHQYSHDGVWNKIRVFDDWCMNYTG